jgi:hypothetical protein
VDLNIHETDILAADLEVVFCGLNLATTAAAAGHNFSSRNNRSGRCYISPVSPMSAFNRMRSGVCSIMDAVSLLSSTN